MNLDKLTNELITKILTDELTEAEFVNTLIENELFKDKRSFYLFIMECLFNNKDNFNIVFPIAYYTESEEHIEDNGNYEWEAMTDELIDTINSQI